MLTLSRNRFIVLVTLTLCLLHYLIAQVGFAHNSDGWLLICGLAIVTGLSYQWVRIECLKDKAGGIRGFLLPMCRFTLGVSVCFYGFVVPLLILFADNIGIGIEKKYP